MDIRIKTYGCKVNQYESQLIRENLEMEGHRITGEDTRPDILIVNACCVTLRAENEARKLVQKFSGEGIEVWLTGCLAVKYTNEKQPQIPNIRVITDKQEFSRVQSQIKRFNGHTRAFVKIQDGCNNFCSYCIVPHLRGRSKSRNEKEILEEIKALAGNGYREIVLTGVDLGSYGKDSATDIIRLIEGISAIKDIIRVRLSSIEAFHITKTLTDYIAGNPLVCNHLHIPMQSGSNRILKLMERKYRIEDYRRIVEMVKSDIPDITITTDIITGFPGESGEDFISTCNAVRSLFFMKTHIFTYSPREGTAAYNMKDDIPGNIKKERYTELKNLTDCIGSEVKKGFTGKNAEVLFERRCGDMLTGYSENYIPVKVKTEAAMLNTIRKIKILRLEGGTLIGEPA